MTNIEFALVVIRSANIDLSAKFYQQLGLEFVKHRHGNGLEHYACEIGSVVFEIYPSLREADNTTSTRIGFRIPLIDLVLENLREQAVTIISLPEDSLWGRRMVIKDPDGHFIEIVESS